MISNLSKIFENEQLQFNSAEIEHYLKNVCAVNKKIAGIVCPKSEEEIINLIYFSREKNIPLYTISRGHNYGLGSRLPVEDDHLIVDLSKMNRILDFDNDLGVIQIEPGVTQQDIANYLQETNADFILNVTGSSSQSSIIGNALERGVAHYGSRISEVINLDLILGDGNKVSTNILNNTYPHGLGPDLKGLFFQSNFGIVTSITLRLLPKTQSVVIITLEKKNSIPLEIFINQLRIAKQRQLLPENLHISNYSRRLSVITPLIARKMNISITDATKIAKESIQPDWAATASIRGERAVLETQIQCLKNFLNQYATISALFDSDLKNESNPFISALKGTIGHSLGIPCSDALLSLGYGMGQLINEALEESNIGTLFLIPVLPLRGRDFLRVTNCIIDKFKKYHFEPYITFNLIEQICLEGVINLTFLKSDTNAVSSAHLCIQETLSALEDLGYPPMRLSIFQKSSFLYKNETIKKTIHNLKNIFDPDNIIARGRYEPN
jgi:4-cresol dehydrogenase (hydroxylating)